MTAQPTLAATHPVRRRATGRWIVASAASATVLAGVYTMAVLTQTGQSIEDSILRSVDGSTLLQSGVALDAISPPAVLLIVGITMAVAFIRRRPAAAVQAGVLIVGATVTTQVLKQLAPRPELTGEIYGNSFPSGHVTVAVAAVLAIMTTFGRHIRPLLFMVGAAFAAVVAEQTVAYGWHRCSDVVGACAVALFWLGLVRIVASRVSRSSPTRDDVGPRSHGATSIVLGLALVVCLTASGAIWSIGIGSDMSLTTSTGHGVLLGARLAAAGVVLVTCWIAWKLDRKG